MRVLRLKKQKEIGGIIKTGKRARFGALSVCYLPSAQTKVAVCVGKKFGKSVQRNRIKRLLREAFRFYCNALTPCRILLIPRVGAEFSYEGLKSDLGKILKKERLLEN